MPALVALIVVLVLLLIVVMALVGMYNRLVTYRNRYKNAYSQIDVQLKRRYSIDYQAIPGRWLGAVTYCWPSLAR